MARGVAIVPAVPGLAPGAFIRVKGQGEGLPVLSRRPVPHKSPQRKLGDCDVALLLDKSQAQAGPAIWGGMGGVARGVAIVPAVPGLAPGAFM